MKEKFKQTLEIFMEDYAGFDWENGKIILVIDNRPRICTGSWKILIERNKNKKIKNWTHDKDTIVITL